ncbi:unnamed protein product [Ilex paraguariensis]|uniref:Non-haem dioxygenase N-terminal domain-containing protein n=1 Tax=Ilex paraguariensis TaxID=185542 RepID=A0ABC8SJR7_9AQUA
MGEVDAAFIQATEHRPKLAIVEADGIPLIDLSVLNSPDLPEPDAATIRPLIAEIGEACENWGFFQVINHGVPLERQKNLEVAARKFFALSKQEKKKVGRDEVNPLGYYDTEHTKNVRDWKEAPLLLGRLPPSLIFIFGKLLGLAATRIPGALVILAQDDVGGLEMKQKANGKWIRVKPIRGAYIINVGDIIQKEKKTRRKLEKKHHVMFVFVLIFFSLQMVNAERSEQPWLAGIWQALCANSWGMPW